jgi:hypothetical protein
VEKSTRVQYSYSIIEAAAEQQPGVVYLPKRATQ